jgi:hypothetical protein
LHDTPITDLAAEGNQRGLESSVKQLIKRIEEAEWGKNPVTVRQKLNAWIVGESEDELAPIFFAMLRVLKKSSTT